MLFIYRVIINLLVIISPIIFIFRILKDKEDPLRLKEKYGIYTKRRSSGKLIWFHGSSVGEILSILPLIKKLEKKRNIKQILLTSSTLSSSKVFKKFNLNKTIHQFFPIDSSLLIKKFLNYWKPSAVFFIESEIWPNAIIEIKNNNIPLILINARITKNSFSKWRSVKFFSNNIFGKFDECWVQNLETFNFLRLLGGRNIKNLGNLKFSENLNLSKNLLKKKLSNFFKKRKKIFGAISTHYNEEIFCAQIHKNLKAKIPNLLTVIIPRHIERSDNIIDELNKLNLKIHRYSSNKKMKDDIDIFLVDTFGETKSFLRFCNIVFLGGSLIKHGGQNPLEAARFGCKVLHGKNISNFKEIYYLLKKQNISLEIKNKNKTVNLVHKLINHKKNKKKKVKSLKLLGRKILNDNYKEVIKYI